VSSFRQEIGEQPEVAARLLGQRAAIEAIGAAINAASPVGIMIAARGSSDHAAIYAKYIFQSRNRLPVALAAPSLFTHYGLAPRVDRYCVMGISQSGSSPDVTAVIAEARRQGALTIAISNHPDSQLAAAAEHQIGLNAGREHSVPASKTYTATLMAIAMLSLAMNPDAAFDAGLRAIPGALRLAMNCEDHAASMAAALPGPRLIVIGRGFNLSTAEEIALKLTETSYVLARAWSAADFLHGPIAVLDRGFPVLVVETAGPAFGETRRLATQLLAKGTPVFQLADATSPLSDGTPAIRLHSGLPESLTPLPLTIAGQLLAYHLAKARGLDPDRPRALKKVTQTW
jgi:glucosamine--fructose-6-phosphate aminotransferase (isomerizing)